MQRQEGSSALDSRRCQDCRNYINHSGSGLGWARAAGEISGDRPSCPPAKGMGSSYSDGTERMEIKSLPDYFGKEA